MFALHPPSRSERLPTFHHQRSLPRLPVPSLRDSLDRYLKSVEPLVAQDEEKGGESATQALKKRTELIHEFENGVGKVLQERLIDLDRSSPHNWLNDNFWLKKAYHEWRAPLPVNSNWWLLFRDDPNVPEELSRSGAPNGEFSDWQIRRAAWLVGRLQDFKDKLERQEIHPDSSRTGPFCMFQYSRLFNICRVPQVGCDTLTQPPKPNRPSARKVTVMLKDWIFTVEVYDRDGNRVDVAEIENRLWSIVNEVKAREARGENAKQVGILTADERDIWAKNREHLVTLSPTNRQSMTAIEESLFTLSLDSFTLPPRPPPSSSSSSLTNPIVDAQVYTTAFGGPSGLNRWFDKALTVCVESNGRAGMMGEHSPCDALIPSIIVDYAIGEHIDPTAFADSWSTSSPASSGGVESLDWQLDSRLEKEIERAKGDAQAMIADSQPSQLWYNEYGTEWIKSEAKCSPDAYIQMALQLAWFRDQGYMTATYETASTRLYEHGRTEVIRTLSTESRNWVKAMEDSSSKTEDRKVLLLDAIKVHNTYTRDASTGKGCDRHLSGLKWLLREGEEVPEFFKDEMFARSSEWKLSTSGLSSGVRFNGTGFGTVWPDGYGINYLAGPQIIKFGIESKVSCPTTSTYRFKDTVAQSMRDMRALFDPPRNSKL